MSVLLACRLYTKPLLLLKKLRSIWEREGTAQKSHQRCRHRDGKTHVTLPEEFGTIRRRKSSRKIHTSTRPETGASFDQILDQIDQLAEKIKKEEFMKEFAAEIQREKPCEKGEERYSRDSGIASISSCDDSLSSSTETSSLGEIAPEVTQVQLRVSECLRFGPIFFKKSSFKN